MMKGKKRWMKIVKEDMRRRGLQQELIKKNKSAARLQETTKTCQQGLAVDSEVRQFCTQVASKCLFHGSVLLHPNFFLLSPLITHALFTSITYCFFFLNILFTSFAFSFASAMWKRNRNMAIRS